MAAIGSVWDPNTWPDTAWAAHTWGDAVETVLTAALEGLYMTETSQDCETVTATYPSAKANASSSDGPNTYRL